MCVYSNAEQSLCWMSLRQVTCLFIHMQSVVYALLSVMFVYCHAECHYAECHVCLNLCWAPLCWMSCLLIVMLSVIMLSVIFVYGYAECSYKWHYAEVMFVYWYAEHFLCWISFWSAVFVYCYAECLNAEYHFSLLLCWVPLCWVLCFRIALLSVVMLSVVSPFYWVSILRTS
jgi:hypothetical protein